jgi:hypothetical protein
MEMYTKTNMKHKKITANFPPRTLSEKVVKGTRIR